VFHIILMVIKVSYVGRVGKY